MAGAFKLQFSAGKLTRQGRECEKGGEGRAAERARGKGGGGSVGERECWERGSLRSEPGTPLESQRPCDSRTHTLHNQDRLLAGPGGNRDSDSEEPEDADPGK
eukprot:1459938-Rhodomonas_salina.1